VAAIKHAAPSIKSILPVVIVEVRFPSQQRGGVWSGSAQFGSIQFTSSALAWTALNRLQARKSADVNGGQTISIAQLRENRPGPPGAVRRP
jgi:hypothetical protein